MEVWKIMFLSKWVIYMFHVNLPGCNRICKGLGAECLRSTGNTLIGGIELQVHNMSVL